jgi:hypothetical protein
VEVIKYINNGFALIDKECAEFEGKINAVKGKFFLHHDYSEEELVHSNHIDKIRSIAGKMGSDMENWKARGLITASVNSYYANKVDMLKQRMTYMMEKLKFRRKTVWDSMGEFFLSTYYFIFNIAFYHFRNTVMSGTGNGALAKMYAAFSHSASNFEDFVGKMYSDKDTGTDFDFTAGKRA